MLLYYSSGAGLRQLYCTSQVQQFINSNSLKDEKAIYYPGALRKVSSHFHSIMTSPCSSHITLILASYILSIGLRTCYDKQTRRLREVNCSLHLPPFVSFSSEVLEYGAVVAQSGDLSDAGDFVMTTDEKVS